MNLNKDFLAVQKLLFDALGFVVSNLKIDAESIEYAACTFMLNNHSIAFRRAKITPTKIGQFVTHWKRNLEGITEPFHIADGIDFTIICTRSDNNLGAFIFPKLVMQEKGILSDKEKEGKRGFRVYPPWDIAQNKQAIQTQKWQLEYFFEIPYEIEKAMILFKK